MTLRPTLLALLLAVTTVPAVSAGSATAAGAPALQAPSAIQRWEDDGTVVIRVSLSKKAKGDVSVAYKTVDGSAKAGKDYEKRSGKVTIKKGRTTAKVTVELIDDRLVEPTETFKVVLSATGTKPSKKTVTVTVTDEDQTARNLTGTVTLDYQVRQTGDDVRGTDISFTMNLDLAPTIPGLEGIEWRDLGTGTWTLSGSEYTNSPYPEDGCQYSHTTQWADSGTFYPGVHTGGPALGKAILNLFSYRPETKAETPVLDWWASAAGERTNYQADIDTGGCVSTVSEYGILHRVIWPSHLAGAPASYTGVNLGSRGLSFDYTFTRNTPAAGGVSTETATVSGDLHPVG